MNQSHQQILQQADDIYLEHNYFSPNLKNKTLYICYLATANKALTDFSPSPIHLEVIVEALILKNVELD